MYSPCFLSRRALLAVGSPSGGGAAIHTPRLSRSNTNICAHADAKRAMGCTVEALWSHRAELSGIIASCQDDSLKAQVPRHPPHQPRPPLTSSGLEASLLTGRHARQSLMPKIGQILAPVLASFGFNVHPNPNSALMMAFLMLKQKAEMAGGEPIKLGAHLPCPGAPPARARPELAAWKSLHPRADAQESTSCKRASRARSRARTRSRRRSTRSPRERPHPALLSRDGSASGSSSSS